MLGTDYAFDMAEFSPVDFVSGAGLPPAQLKAVLGDNARELFGVGSAVGAAGRS
jgi:predicted TIM-barrel fold metal-dependent hydrolase